MYPNISDPTAGIFIHQQVYHLARVGYKVMVISPVPYVPKILAKKYEHYAKIPKESMIADIPIIHPRYLRPPSKFFHAPSNYSMYHSVKKTISKLVRRFAPHLLHAHTATPDGYTGLLLKRKFGLPLVVSLRGSDVNVYPYRDRWTFYLTQRVISEADGLIAVSQALKSGAEKIARPMREIKVVYTGCDTKKFLFDKGARMELRQKLKIPPTDPVLIFVGHIIKPKGIYDLLEAFSRAHRRYPNLHLIIVGAGEESKKLKKVAEIKGLKEWVYFMGPQPHDEIPKWLSAADIFVLPSWREGLPNAVVEAMACERPVIATRVGGIPEAVEDNESGILIEKQNIESLKEAIIALVEDKSKREKMGHRGREIVTEKFTWDANIRNLIKVYDEVIDGHQ